MSGPQRRTKKGRLPAKSSLPLNCFAHRRYSNADATHGCGKYGISPGTLLKPVLCAAWQPCDSAQHHPAADSRNYRVLDRNPLKKKELTCVQDCDAIAGHRLLTRKAKPARRAARALSRQAPGAYMASAEMLRLNSGLHGERLHHSYSQK